MVLETFIDPGWNVVGLAEFRDRVLVRAEIFRLDKDKDRFHAAAEIAQHISSAAIYVEDQQVYPGAEQDPNDLLKVAKVAGAIAAAHSPQGTVAWMMPRVWTRSVKKRIRHLRQPKRLSVGEQALIDAIRPASLAHNAKDAVGMGLYRYKRDREC